MRVGKKRERGREERVCYRTVEVPQNETIGTRIPYINFPFAPILLAAASGRALEHCKQLFVVHLELLFK